MLKRKFSNMVLINGNKVKVLADLGRMYPQLRFWERLCKCEFCGKWFPKWKILDPNKFPDNNPEDTWKVCTTCRIFINVTFHDGYRALLKWRNAVKIKEMRE